MPLNFDDYEASFYDKERGDPFYAIEKEGQDVLRIKSLDLGGNVLHCPFELQDASLSHDDVAGLVYVVLLGKFLRRRYMGRAKYVELEDLSTGVVQRNIYLG
ncbi:hypothetical protein [Streptomyces sp. NPDC056304]|uniref:hypothetical protein n=1 Tax=Streptomyces sp. NPDC056304 TaxID=3345778 RepID=UPI0035DA5783